MPIFVSTWEAGGVRMITQLCCSCHDKSDSNGQEALGWFATDQAPNLLSIDSFVFSSPGTQETRTAKSIRQACLESVHLISFIHSFIHSFLTSAWAAHIQKHSRSSPHSAAMATTGSSPHPEAVTLPLWACRAVCLGAYRRSMTFGRCSRGSRDGWRTIPEDRFSSDAYYHPNPQKKGCFNQKGGLLHGQRLLQVPMLHSFK